MLFFILFAAISTVYSYWLSLLFKNKSNDKSLHINIFVHRSRYCSTLNTWSTLACWGKDRYNLNLRETFKVFFKEAQFSHSVVSDSATPWTVARQASLSITNFWSLLKLMSIESVMPSKEATTIRFWCPPPRPPAGVGVLLQGHLEIRVSFALLWRGAWAYSQELD